MGQPRPRKRIRETGPQYVPPRHAPSATGNLLSNDALLREAARQQKYRDELLDLIRESGRRYAIDIRRQREINEITGRTGKAMTIKELEDLGALLPLSIRNGIWGGDK